MMGRALTCPVRSAAARHSRCARTSPPIITAIATAVPPSTIGSGPAGARNRGRRPVTAKTAATTYAKGADSALSRESRAQRGVESAFEVLDGGHGRGQGGDRDGGGAAVVRHRVGRGVAGRGAAVRPGDAAAAQLEGGDAKPVPGGAGRVEVRR